MQLLRNAIPEKLVCIILYPVPSVCLELGFNEKYLTSVPIGTLQILYALSIGQTGGQIRAKAY